LLRVDHFASTVRGLFLSPGGLARGADCVSLAAEPIPPGAAAAVEVLEAPEGARVRRLEVIESLSGAPDAWRTLEVDLTPETIFVGALGGRFANRSVSGHAPPSPAPPGSVLDLLNTGGVIGVADSADEAIVKVRLLGGIELEGGPALLSGLPSIQGAAAHAGDQPYPGAPIVLIAGSDMDVGKTTCAASLAFSLRVAGIRVTYVKLTGTGRMRDLIQVCYGRPSGYFDSHRLGWDFVDAGLATTFEIGERESRRCARILLRHAAQHGEIVLAEIADAPNAPGSIHTATDPWLLGWLRWRGLVICACDSLDSTLTVLWLKSHVEIENKSILISGRVANDPAMRKEVERMTGMLAVSCTAPGRMSPHGGQAPGGALADWVIRHVISLRKAIE